MRRLIAFAGLGALMIPPVVLAEDPVPASDTRVVAVRQAARVAMFVQMKRSVELSKLPPEEQAKVIAIIDPALEKENKLIADVKDHPDNSEKDTADADAAMKDAMKSLMEKVPVDDRPKLDATVKAVNGEATLFSAAWPLAGHPDPLPDLIKSVGLTEKQADEIEKIREHAKAASDALLDEQTAAVFAANGKDVDSKLWTDDIGAVGTDAAEKVLAGLSAEQRAKWDQKVLEIFPLKNAR